MNKNITDLGKNNLLSVNICKGTIVVPDINTYNADEKKLYNRILHDDEVLKKDIPILIAFNQRLCVTMHNKKMVILDMCTDYEGRTVHSFLSENEFKLKYKPYKIAIRIYTLNGPSWKNVSAAQYWCAWKFRRQAESTIFNPKYGLGCIRNFHYNLYPGFSVKPSKGDCSLILNHLKDIWCCKNENYYKYLINWFAHLIQFPWEKPNVALVIKGGKGAGKTTIFESIFMKILGTMYSKITNQEQVTGKFNSHHVDKLLLVLEEAYWAGDKGAEGTLKSMITDTYTLIEPKGVDAYNVDTYYRLAFVSNEKRVVPVSIDERRFFALSVSSEKAMDHDYFRALREEINGNGVAAFMHELKAYKVDKDLLLRPPYTAALFDDILESFSKFERWVYALLLLEDNEEAGIVWGEKVTKYDLFQFYDRWSENNKKLGVYNQSGKIGSQAELTRSINNFFRLAQTKHNNLACYVFPERQVLRDQFEKKINAIVKWEDEVSEEDSMDGFFSEHSEI